MPWRPPLHGMENGAGQPRPDQATGRPRLDKSGPAAFTLILLSRTMPASRHRNAGTAFAFPAADSAAAYLGMLPSIPSTYILSESKVACAMVAPAATSSFPVLSLIGPANGFSVPATIAAFLSSKTLTAAGGKPGLGGAIPTMR